MNRIGRFLVYAVGIYGAFWAYWALRDLYYYWRLDEKTQGLVEKAEVVELSSSRFDIRATYSYSYHAQDYTSTSSLGKPYQLNLYAAQRAADSLQGKEPLIYFNRRHPEISALKRPFPYKSVFQAILLLGICFYLWILNLYYAPKKRK